MKMKASMKYFLVKKMMNPQLVVMTMTISWWGYISSPVFFIGIYKAVSVFVEATDVFVG